MLRKSLSILVLITVVPLGTATFNRGLFFGQRQNSNDYRPDGDVLEGNQGGGGRGFGLGKLMQSMRPSRLLRNHLMGHQSFMQQPEPFLQPNMEQQSYAVYPYSGGIPVPNYPNYQPVPVGSNVPGIEGFQYPAYQSPVDNNALVLAGGQAAGLPVAAEGPGFRFPEFQDAPVTPTPDMTSTTTTTLNPRLIDLLYGSNLNTEQPAANQPNFSKPSSPPPVTSPRCPEGYVRSGDVCLPRA